jgi:hypothetical protein
VTAVPVRLLYQSTSHHLDQLYTGFLMLHANGIIQLSQQKRTTPIDYANEASHLRDAGHAHLDAVVEGVKLHFDTHDAMELAEGELERCDLYFKRSYSGSLVEKLPIGQRNKVRPLGFNYRVLPDLLDSFSIARTYGLKGMSRSTLASFKRAIDAGNSIEFHPRAATMQSPPEFSAPPQVLFLTAAYDPYEGPDRSKEKIEDRIHVNETRARCMRALREALGTRFTGGFSASKYTLAHYPDLALPPEATSQKNYLQTLKSFPICVATTGLHRSNGWKLAEYIAFSKAILTEKLAFEVPGHFKAARNYLEFSSPEECVHGALKLIEDRNLRQALMHNNAAYYQLHLRPDRLIRNALTVALEHLPVAQPFCEKERYRVY